MPVHEPTLGDKEAAATNYQQQGKPARRTQQYSNCLMEWSGIETPANLLTHVVKLMNKEVVGSVLYIC